MNVTRRARLLNHRALRDTTILNSPFSILNLFYKNKKAPVPDFSWDRSECALAVPPRLTRKCAHSAHTSINACSPDNGRSPRRSYLAEAVRLALLKSIHTVRACRNHTACGSLGGSVSLLLVFVIGLCWFTWYGHSIFAKQWIVKCDLRKIIYYFCYKFLL